MSNISEDTSATSQQKLFSVWLADRKIMILDSNTGSRNGIAKLLVSLGAKTNHILLATDGVSAREEIAKKFPSVIISDYRFTGGDGLGLAQELHHLYGEQEKIFILFTSDGSQSLVAQAAEEDVDLYILKPYTIKNFSESFTRVVLSKIYPSEYLKTIEEGKKLLKASDPDAALEKFKKAKDLSDKPTLALYYKAQAELYKKMLGEAESTYLEGLKLNDIHYRCLTGMFDLLMSQNKTVDAYAVVKKISGVFPSNPKRLAQLVGLSVQTGNFQDIQDYYEAFKGLDSRSDDLIKTVCASLVISAKHALSRSNPELAYDLLKKAAVSAAGNVTILKEVILTLCEMGRTEDATQVLKRFPSEASTHPAYLISRFAVKVHEESDSLVILNEIQILDKRDLKDPYLSWWKIRHLKKIGKNEQLEASLSEALANWPERKSYFQEAAK